jgi:hypothetical protein
MRLISLCVCVHVQSPLDCSTLDTHSVDSSTAVLLWALTYNSYIILCVRLNMPTPGFSTVLERSGRRLSGEIVGIIVRCGTDRALQLQARSAPRSWHNLGSNIPDGHQNGLIWGPLVPWKPVNALMDGRRLCDLGSV